MMRKYSIIFLVILSYISLFMAFQCKAVPVWSDDFNGGAYEGWTVSGAINPWAGNVADRMLAKGNFSTADKTLQAIGDPSLWSWASHPSTVAYGTWSFDVYCNPEGTQWGGFGVTWNDKPNFIIPLDWHGYELDIMDAGYVMLHSWDGSSYQELMRNTFARTPGSWIHIDVTRDAYGRFCVYTDGSLKIDVVDNRYTTFGYFIFESQPGNAIDNIVVSNTVDIQPLIPFYMQTWFLATVGAIIVVLVVVIVFFLRRKANTV